MPDPFAYARTTITAPLEPTPAGPITVAEAPAGGPAWIVTDHTLARAVLSDPRISKDPAHAPAHWDRISAGLEPTAAERPSLTTLEGAAHAAVRRAHAPLLTARRMQAHAGRIGDIAREQLTALAGSEPVDLLADFTTRFPLTVILELLGSPAEGVDIAAAACRQIMTGQAQPPAVAAIEELAGTALASGQGNLAVDLRARMPAGTTDAELRYMIFGLILAAQITTETALGHLMAHALSSDEPVEPLVHGVLRRHPPAPFTLWRFTTTELELAGHRLPARAPILVDIEGINAGINAGPDLTFGAGPHYCVGAQLAQIELTAAAQVLRTDFPDARLAVPFDQLLVDRIGVNARRLAALPVVLGTPA